MTDVIMPALGMAQDTGKLVQWLKASGDAVAEGDVLFEVETDKSVMEVEAQADGFLTRVSARDGDDIPVGQVIAIISATKDDPGDDGAASGDPSEDASYGTASKEEPAATDDATPAPKNATTLVGDTAPAPKTAPAPAAGDRILASPKARRLAAEEGLDLARLVAAGAPMPYHVADLATLRDMASAPDQAGPQKAAAQVIATKQITARCPRAGSVAFIDWMQADGGVTVTPRALFASFVAGAWRAATDAATVVVHVTSPDGDDAILRDPDFTRLSAAPVKTDADANIALHDLTDSFLTSLHLGNTSTPALSIGVDGDSYVISLAFGGDHIADDQAIAFVSGLAQRLVEPLHHLV